MTTIFWNLVEQQADAARWLSPSEQERLDGMRFAARRQSFLLGRMAAKKLLRQHPACAHLPPSAITIANHPAGDPYAVVGGEALAGCLSLSHRHDQAAGALTLAPGAAVGIDLEVVEARPAVFTADYFTPEEARFVASVPAVQAALWVTCFWSAKEAVFKALKTGLRLDTRAVSLSPGPEGRPPADWQPHQPLGWQPLLASGPALQGSRGRVWWRVAGQTLVTLAVITAATDTDAFETIYETIYEMIYVQ